MLSAIILVSLSSLQVESVVVYPDRAQVTRVAQVPCAGRTTVAFEAIPPAADPGSFRAQVASGKVEGLQAEERTRKEAFSKELERLEAALRETDKEQKALTDEAARAAGAKRLGASYEAVATALISRDMAQVKPDLRAWQSAFDQSLGAKLQAATLSADLAQKQRLLSWRIEDLQRARQGLQGAASRQEYAVKVQVSCPKGRSTQVRLTYLVGAARWAPSYEARADEPRGVELTTYATVRQGTGEDWRGAKLLLSTAIPSQDATVPELRPLKVHIQQRSDEKKVLVRREEVITHAQVSDRSDASGEQALSVREQGLSVQLEVEGRADVPGNDSPVRLRVGRHRLPATFAWRSVPALAPFAFRAAEVTNAAPFPLLEGPLEAFGRSGFLGRYPLERVAQGGSFRLTFGVEDAVKVKRVTIEEVKRDSGLFGQRKRFRYAYRFEVTSYADRPVELELSDRVPVSELDDISVQVGERTTRGYSHLPQDGVVTWKLKLDPGKEQKVELFFHVDVPDSYDTGGL